MKIILILLVSMLFSFINTSYCDGWENGYEEGYCYEEYACIAPIAPICPIERIGESGYTDGYNRGFRKGLSDADKD